MSFSFHLDVSRAIPFRFNRDLLICRSLMRSAVARVRAGEWSPPDGGTTTPAAPTGRDGFDLHPVWDGKDPVHKWLRWKRTVLLWEADSEIHEETRGVRVFRHDLVHNAADIAHAKTDDLR